MDTDGSERYSRCTKSIVQVDPSSAASSSQIMKPVGLAAGDRARSKPYSVPHRSTLPVRVIYQGRPLAGGLVKLTDLTNDASPLEVHLTDSAGRATFTTRRLGQLAMVNVIWTMAQTGLRVGWTSKRSSGLKLRLPCRRYRAHRYHRAIASAP